MQPNLNSPFVDDGHFEAEVRRMAKLIWPSGKIDRSPIVEGHERDAIVQTRDIITVIEATTSRKTNKISEDAKKTNILVKNLRSQGFACQGILVTLSEPTAEQEAAAKQYSTTVRIESFSQFLARLFDASEYLQNRDK